MYKIFDIGQKKGNLNYQEFSTSFRTKMKNLDQNNMLVIEKSLKKAFRSIDESNTNL